MIEQYIWYKFYSVFFLFYGEMLSLQRVSNIVPVLEI